MDWSSEQQRLLGAMGYELLVRATAAPAGSADVAIAAASARHPPAAAFPAASVAAGGAGPAEAFVALRRAVRRAAGEHEPGALVADYGRLQREPALKRALWPRLRALRRNH